MDWPQGSAASLLAGGGVMDLHRLVRISLVVLHLVGVELTLFPTVSASSCLAKGPVETACWAASDGGGPGQGSEEGLDTPRFFGWVSRTTRTAAGWSWVLVGGSKLGPDPTEDGDLPLRGCWAPLKLDRRPSPAGSGYCDGRERASAR